MPKKAPVIETGEVVETVGKRVRVRVGDALRVLPFRGVQVVVGDRVGLSDGVVVSHEPRRTILLRAGEIMDRLICANATLLISVNASMDPPFRTGLVDRLLVTASIAGLDPAILLNKCDLGMPEHVLERMAYYEALEIPIFLVSATQQKGLETLRERLKGETAVFVGHSGVGKTSLMKALIPGIEREVGELDAWGRGRHTTTSTALRDLPDGGRIIDIPGVREFGIGNLTRSELRQHFPELAPLRCKYHNCAHDRDDGCIAEDHCDAERLDSYRKLLSELERS